MSWLTLLTVTVLLFDVAAAQFVVETIPGYPGKLPFKLETGYIGVGDVDEVQFFYYFVESQRNPTVDPLILWLTGGPGCSALSGLIYEIGPLQFNYSSTSVPTFILNNNSWTQVASIIFVDTPVGTGFSYSNTQEGYHSSDTLTASDIYVFLRKWLLGHPNFLLNRLYVAGDSYSGIPVPLVVSKIVDGNDNGENPPLNLEGYILGNPYSDYSHDSNSKVPYAHRVNLLSDELYESFKVSCDGKYVNPDTNSTQCAEDIVAIHDCIDLLYTGQILEPNCSVRAPKPSHDQWDPSTFEEDNLQLLHTNLDELPEPWCRDYNYLSIYTWANDKLVQEALHVRQIFIRLLISNPDTSDNLPTSDCGDQDLAIPYVGTLGWIRSLGLPLVGEWRPWFVDGQVAGYTVKYSNVNYRLTYATVKGAGHTAPEYKPVEALAMVYSFFSLFPL
ncbi:hypothetical protein Nepgr_015430 [Nepenthes gracilis]|uniref:Uncharacterized protein n=1 Tax=Nepenthes gracilis TaxID=150966 RepID=A0AAD3XR38_NEPGR|nr:hypothetical protein Nepgr_015430 [Nepenthes gracilis]